MRYPHSLRANCGGLAQHGLVPTVGWFPGKPGYLWAALNEFRGSSDTVHPQHPELVHFLSLPLASGHPQGSVPGSRLCVFRDVLPQATRTSPLRLLVSKIIPRLMILSQNSLLFPTTFSRFPMLGPYPPATILQAWKWRSLLCEISLSNSSHQKVGSSLTVSCWLGMRSTLVAVSYLSAILCDPH